MSRITAGDAQRVTFCEANDCDTRPDSKACEVLRANYARITGDFAFPCEVVEPPTP